MRSKKAGKGVNLHFPRKNIERYVLVLKATKNSLQRILMLYYLLNPVRSERKGQHEEKFLTKKISTTSNESLLIPKGDKKNGITISVSIPSLLKGKRKSGLAFNTPEYTPFRSG